MGSHAIGHQLSLLYDTTHGASLSIAFPAWMKHMIPRIGHRLETGRTCLVNPPPKEQLSILKNFLLRYFVPSAWEYIGITADQKEEIVTLMNKNEVNGKNPENRLNDKDREQIVDLMFAG